MNKDINNANINNAIKRSLEYLSDISKEGFNNIENKDMKDIINDLEKAID